jgi:hypothetical protein
VTPASSTRDERSTSRAKPVAARSEVEIARPAPNMIAQLTSESTMRMESTTCVAVLACRMRSFADVGTAPAAWSISVM